MTGAAFGIGRIHWNWLGALVVLLAALPLVSEINTPTLLAVWALFALSLALMWGFAGILSFGHAAYFGLGAYIAKAFITVITGGAAVIAGTLSTAGLFGTVDQLVSFASTPVLGEIAMLALALVLLRLMPQGVTGQFFRNST